MDNYQYYSIKTSADVLKFQDISNGLHDGFITHIEYNNSGITTFNSSLLFDHGGKSLVIHVLVTSLLGSLTFEIAFSNILEWQINEHHFSDIIGFSILFLDNGMMLWADDISHNISDLKQGCYVIAESIQYRQL